MRKIKLNKPLIESPIPPSSTNVYWVDIDEKTGKLKAIKEFQNNKWTTILNITTDDHSVQLKPKDNEIWYLTKDNSIFTVLQLYFDSQIISNIVSNGVGVITFSSPLLKLNDYAFDDESNNYIGRTNLVRLVLPDCIESFGLACFRGLNNLEVNIPKNLKGEIPWDCFYNCRSIKHIVISDGITSLGNQEYGGYCFYQCESLESVYLPEGITVIYDLTFAECNALKEIVLPSTITKLGSSIFEGLPSILIVYRGTIELWNAIDKDTDWFYSLTNEQPIVHCIDGDVTN